MLGLQALMPRWFMSMALVTAVVTAPVATVVKVVRYGEHGTESVHASAGRASGRAAIVREVRGFPETHGGTGMGHDTFRRTYSVP